VHLRVADVDASKRFYPGALAPLGLGITGEGDGWSRPTSSSLAPTGLPRPAFTSPSKRRIGRPWIAFMLPHLRRAGAITALQPTGRTTPGYYGAYVLDPHGTNVEPVYHGPAKYSTSSV
jgi:hypothetical protein